MKLKQKAKKTCYCVEKNIASKYKLNLKYDNEKSAQQFARFT